MQSHNDKLYTPVFVKTDENLPLPEDLPVFHVLSRDGLFLCRNHPFFRSSVRVEQFPSELAGHGAFLKLRYPKLPRKLVEQIVGFFSIVGRRFASEAAVLLAWDKTASQVVPIVPEQTGIVSEGWYGNPYPIELQYKIPALPPHLTLIGDVHSHVDGPAYASPMDKADEEYRAGLHIVVGRVQLEPPEFHCEVTVDGARFIVRDLGTVFAGYQRRRERDVPQPWLDKLTVKPWSSLSSGFANQRPRNSNSQVQDAMVVDEPKSASPNGKLGGDEIATMTAPSVVRQGPDHSTKNKP